MSPWNLKDIDWKSAYCYKITTRLRGKKTSFKSYFLQQEDTAVFCWLAAGGLEWYGTKHKRTGMGKGERIGLVDVPYHPSPGAD